MKRLALLAIPILAVTFSAGGITANAAENGINYPEDDQFTRYLTFSSLTDYAVEGNLYAFADGKSVKIYADGNYDEYLFEKDVTAVDINDGVIYYSLGDTAYSLPEKPEPDHDFKEKPSSITYGNFHYYFSGDQLKILNQSDDSISNLEGFSNLNKFNDKVYAVSENSLYEFTGSEKQKVVLEYAVSASDIEIKIGNSKDKLKLYNGVQFVDIAKDTYLTEVDLYQLKGENFVALDIVKTDKVTTALLLCESGNGAIVSIHEKAYAVLNEKIESRTVIDTAIEKPYEAQVVGTDIYASPFTSSGTSANSNATNIIVTVIGRVENSILESVFCEVEYKIGEERVKGYVVEGLLKPPIKDDNQPEYRTDPDESYSTDTKTILIVLAVVFLVLAAILYISHVSSKGKKKDKKKKEE